MTKLLTVVLQSFVPIVLGFQLSELTMLHMGWEKFMYKHLKWSLMNLELRCGLECHGEAPRCNIFAIKDNSCFLGNFTIESKVIAGGQGEARVFFRKGTSFINIFISH